jgi:serine/threonine protein phosphatase 1
VFLLDYFRDSERFKHWRPYGGLDTLMSYGVVPRFNPSKEQLEALATSLYKSMPAAHVEFLDRLQSWFECGNYLFVHAGFDLAFRFLGSPCEEKNPQLVVIHSIGF